MATLKKAKTVSLVQDVCRQIEEAILTGEYQPGDRLPSTRDLQEILAASLGTIRESLAILEQKGLLEVKKGAKGGFFVREISTKPVRESLATLMRHKGISHRELYEFRMFNESAIIQLVIWKATDEEIRSLFTFYDQMKTCLGQGHKGWIRFVDVENSLRRALLTLTRNRTYELVLRPIFDNLEHYARNHLLGGDRETQIAFDYWERIFDAVSRRDEAQAVEQTRALLLRFMDIITNYPGDASG